MGRKPLCCLSLMSITASQGSAAPRTRNASETTERVRNLSAICPQMMRTRSGLEKRREEKIKKRTPLPPTRGTDALTRGGRKPREVRDASLQAWLDVCSVVDETGNTKGVTWDHAKAKLGEKAHEAIEKIGGYRAIFVRNQFTTGDLKSRFRDAYERLVESTGTQERASA